MTPDPSVCAYCGKPRKRRRDGGWQGARGWCLHCYKRWCAAGKPGSGVPPVMTHAERVARSTATIRRARDERLETYAMARSWGESREWAADYAGVSEERARRVYDRLLAGVPHGLREAG